MAKTDNLRVKVWDAGKENYLGEGCIIGERKVLGITTPKILLDTGKIVFGYETWWRPVGVKT